MIYWIGFTNYRVGKDQYLENRSTLKSIWNTAVGIKNCKQLFSLRLAFTTQKKNNTYSGDDVPTMCCYFYFLITYGVCKKRKYCNRMSEKKILSFFGL